MQAREYPFPYAVFREGNAAPEMYPALCHKTTFSFVLFFENDWDFQNCVGCLFFSLRRSCARSRAFPARQAQRRVPEGLPGRNL